MSNYFFKPELESLSQGAKLKFLRKLRYMNLTDVAEELNLGGKDPTDTIRKYECNSREPELDRVEYLAELFDVSVYAIKRYNFADPNEVIHQHMWEEELCPYSEFIFDIEAVKKTFYTKDIIRGFEAWEKMRKKERTEKYQIEIIWNGNFILI
jgi:transcriptional regulator with XRE-family HTH domain